MQSAKAGVGTLVVVMLAASGCSSALEDPIDVDVDPIAQTTTPQELNGPICPQMIPQMTPDPPDANGYGQSDPNVPCDYYVREEIDSPPHVGWFQVGSQSLSSQNIVVATQELCEASTMTAVGYGYLPGYWKQFGGSWLWFGPEWRYLKTYSDHGKWNSGNCTFALFGQNVARFRLDSYPEGMQMTKLRVGMKSKILSNVGLVSSKQRLFWEH